VHKEGKEGLLFLKKKKQKDFSRLGARRRDSLALCEAAVEELGALDDPRGYRRAVGDRAQHFPPQHDNPLTQSRRMIRLATPGSQFASTTVIVPSPLRTAWLVFRLL